MVVVDDEPGLADLFTAWLERSYEVRTAYRGEPALDAVDADVDVVLVDRLMPGTSGDAVVAALAERDWDGGIAMVTAVDPDFDIVDIAFDDYLIKPIHREVLESTVERLVERSTYDELIWRLFALTSKRAVLEARKSEAELAGSRTYRELTRSIADLRERVDKTAAGLDGEDEPVLRGAD